MASGQNPVANADPFDVYFQRADLDHDGRISGNEAVAFFQGSGLSKQVLAQIWAYADQRQTGFLGRAEFYNALRLVTVAQSKRQLTPEMVKAALYGPAAAKIPPPQINLTATPAPQPNSTPAAPTAAQGTAVAPMSQNLGNRGLQPNVNMNQQHVMKPPLPTSTSASHLTHGLASQGVPRGGTMGGPRPPNSNMSNDWVGGRTGGAPTATSSQVPNKGISPSTGIDGFGLVSSGPTASLPPRPQTASGLKPSGPPAKDAKALDVSGNGFASNSFFGGDVFSATPSQPKQDVSSHAFSASSMPVSSAIPQSAGTPSVRPTSVDSLQSSLMTQISGGNLHQGPPLVKQNQHVSSQTTSTSAATGASVRADNSASGQSQVPWPKISQTDVQKYTKVFVEVDTDRDGKITGEQARNLFLSWRLPREVLKQVWDLSDQDNDSMLSLKEFCIALYLMERYRERRPLPAALPSNIIFELSSILQSTTNYGSTGTAAWRPPSGYQQQQGIPGPGARHMVPPGGPRPPLPVPAPHADEGPQTDKPKSKVPVLEKHLIDQLSTEEQDLLNAKFKEATEADKKVEELEKEILDSQQKIEFYRTKMQELVLYKSRCDNRVNEIMERISADKREVESLSRKYEEKYKQGGDVASKLTIEEATFRDIQEKKMELYQAIVKMEQNGGADGALQVSVDRIQSELDELVKSLNERCKKYGLRGKPVTLTELPFGWQPGIQVGAADWDEDWDKFEDEGFTFVKELTLDVQNVIAPPKQKSMLPQNEEAPPVGSPTTAALPNADVKSDDPHKVDSSSPNADVKSDDVHKADERVVENGSAYNKNEEDNVKSAPNSPFARSAIASPSKEFVDSNFEKSVGTDASPRNKETNSERGDTGSLFAGDKGFDEPAWEGTFDANDDIDSVWGFNSVGHMKDMDHEGNNDYFGTGEFGLNPIKTGSSQASGYSQNSRPFSFDDSVPSTPQYNFSNSPPRYKDGSEPSFDSFSRFDSFSTHDGGGLFNQKETISRFDSMRSSRDFDQGHGFPSFDDSDPFGSSGPFKSTLESQTPRSGFYNWGETPRSSDIWSETPRGGSDIWGETPKGGSDLWSETPKRSSDNWGETPKRGSDNWSAF
ncbi:actin cytoskeleton-regulatory complex protein PAN1 [Ziziphus jujuba]|uniref:Actin cytoskeleton-regulatory complex protein PAN1 n=1 Tax=Ziziphus jujuba TaxID=326968 RepID=A0A6P4AD29_ZIZJJ|nr:actin cytoskeleton-regulatory complex protein PAN1 [Ziziphus jujuba]